MFFYSCGEESHSNLNGVTGSGSSIERSYDFRDSIHVSFVFWKPIKVIASRKNQNPQEVICQIDLFKGSLDDRHGRNICSDSWEEVTWQGRTATIETKYFAYGAICDSNDHG